LGASPRPASGLRSRQFRVNPLNGYLVSTIIAGEIDRDGRRTFGIHVMLYTDDGLVHFTHARDTEDHRFEVGAARAEIDQDSLKDGRLRCENTAIVQLPRDFDFAKRVQRGMRLKFYGRERDVVAEVPGHYIAGLLAAMDAK
jgi:hypothetical protein